MKNILKQKTTAMGGKRSIMAALLLFILMLSICSIAYASSYTTTVKFKNPYQGSMRSFTGDNIMYTATMSSSKKNDSGTYDVDLQRKQGIWRLMQAPPRR